MSKYFSLFIYNLLLPVGFLFMLPGALRKMRRRGGRWSDLGQRLGRLPPDLAAAIATLPAGQDRLWVHAVSVGEVGIATKLLTALLKRAPEKGVILTTTTPTGHALAQEFAARHPGRVVVVYSPFDFPRVGAALLDDWAPSQIILVEAEVWPNLVSLATRRRIPVSLVNARLSPRSERRFQRFGFLIRPVFAQLHQVLVQEPGDVARWTRLGVSAHRIHHTGSIKFDPQGAAADPAQVAAFQALLQTCGIQPSQPLLLAASTHAGEEVELARVYQRLRTAHPGLAFLIVPRHVERAAEIQAQLRSTLGLHALLRSTLQPGAPAPEPGAAQDRLLIINTTGELRAWQCLATAVIVGKSFLAEGGQNPAEAALARIPVLFGPHMENFLALVELLLQHQAALQVAGFPELETALDSLLRHPAQRRQMGEAGHHALHAHEGATTQTVERLLAA